MKKYFLFVFAIPLLFISSCKEGGAGIQLSTGATCEVMVVTDGPDSWNGQLGDTIRQLFGQPIAGLPMPEALMDPMHAPYKVFNDNDMFRRHHNILIVQIDPKQEKPYIDSKKDQWASPQQVFRFIASSDTAMFRLLSTYFKSIYTLFRETEIKRTQNTFKRSTDQEAIDALRSEFGIEMTIPGGFIIAKKARNFLWLRQSIHRSKQDTELGFVFYSVPYTDTANFSPSAMILRRDTIVGRFIPGPTDGSYMTTSKEYEPPIFTRSDKFMTGFVVETKGLWKVVNDFMGGPFVSYSYVDPKNNRLVTAEGYLYGPGTEQRKFMIQLESLLKTIQFYTPENKE
jgi:hypothetical protein